MKHIMLVTTGGVLLSSMVISGVGAVETNVALSEKCSQVRTKGECQNQPGCKVLKGKDGKDYCVANTRDYPPYKGGYPLDE